MSITPEEELNDVCEWAWTEGIAAIDAQDEKYVEVSAHVEMFLVLGNVLEQCGWTRDELIAILDDCAFEGVVPSSERLH